METERKSMLVEGDLPNVRARYLALRALPALQLLEPEALLPLAESSSFARFRAGSWIAREGEPLPAVYIIVEGRVEVRIDTELGEDGESARDTGRLVADPARTVGFVSVLGQDPRGVSAYAHTDVLAMSAPSDVVLDLYESSFALLRNALRNAARAALEARRQLPPPIDPDEEIGEPPSRPLTFVEKILLNRETPLFAGAPIDAVADLAAATEEVRLKAGDLLFELGARADFSFRIHHGRVRCIAERGDSVVVGPGMVLGGLDVAAMLPRSYTAEALTEVVGFRIRSEDFFGMLERHPQLGMKLLSLFSRQIIDAAA